MFGGIPAFGGHSLAGSIERAATLTAKDSRLDIESETFFVAPTLAGGARKSGGYSYDDVPCVAATLDASYGRLQGCSGQDANHGHSHLVVHGTQDPCVLSDQAHALGRNNGQENAVFAIQAGATRENPLSGPDGAGVQEGLAYTIEARSEVQMVADVSPTLRSGNMRNNSNPSTEVDMLVGGPGVRRLTPRECERLQGMPDDYTLIPWRGKPAEECPDGPRYKAIGNSKAVTVVRWIGQRILKQIKPSPYGG